MESIDGQAAEQPGAGGGARGRQAQGPDNRGEDGPRLGDRVPPIQRADEAAGDKEPPKARAAVPIVRLRRPYR